MADRMGRTWSQFRSAGLQALAAGAVVRYYMNSVLEAELGREVEKYTTVRSIFNYAAYLSSGYGTAVMGILLANEELTLGAVDPFNDPESDWLWWEEVPQTSDGNDFDIGAMLHRDISGQRKARGATKALWLYIYNSSGTSSLNYMVSGRTLLLGV